MQLGQRSSRACVGCNTGEQSGQQSTVRPRESCRFPVNASRIYRKRGRGMHHTSIMGNLVVGVDLSPKDEWMEPGATIRQAVAEYPVFVFH